MCDIVGIGAAVYDTLITTASYPVEDTKVRAKGIMQSGGGPAATALVAASKLGAECEYIGVIADDDGGKFLMNDFQKYNVCTNNVLVKPGYVSFSSYIILNEQNLTRTCIFQKGTLPKLSLNESQKSAIKRAKILLVDGNEIEAAIEGAKIAKDNQTKVLYDAGGLYDGVDKLLPYADILIPSEEFALKYTKERDVKSAIEQLNSVFAPEVIVITQGKRGGIWFDGESFKRYGIFDVKVVDSNGAGDVFHGAFAFAQLSGLDYAESCVFSSAASSLKCMKPGAREAAPYGDELFEFLRGKGYEF